MSVKVGINGFGRIGRKICRTALDDADIDFVAVNDLPNTQTLAHLLKYDSMLANLDHQFSATENAISVDEEFNVFSPGTTESQLCSTHRIEELRGVRAKTLLVPATQTISREDLQLSKPDFIDWIWASSDTAFSGVKSLLSMFRNGRLAGTAYFEFCSQGHEQIVGIRALQSIPLLFRTDSGEHQSKHSALQWCRLVPFYADRRSSRRWQEWALVKNKILFFSELTILCASFIGVVIFLTQHFGIPSIIATTALLGIIRTVLNHLAQTS